MIVGGWGYVWAAYGVSWVLLGAYGLRLLQLRRQLGGQAGRDNDAQKR